MARRPASPRVLAVARGDEPADLLLAGGSVFCTATREWVRTELAIADGVIAGWGERDAHTVMEVDGAALTPGFIDAHMHLESTKMWVDEFVSSVLPHGTTTVIADPHEIANVFGVPGVVELVAAAQRMPFTFAVTASSCVPASPFESPLGPLGVEDVRALLDEHGAIGLAEVMNYPATIAGDADFRAKISAAQWRRVDGHAPGLCGAPLDAYLAAGVESDHECVELPEALEKRRKGMWIFIREGSASRNLDALIPMVCKHGADRVALCTDDREPSMILEVGHINDCVRRAVTAGVRPEDALVLATSNAAEYHQLWHLGDLGPGHQADILCFDRLDDWKPRDVLQAGHVVVQERALSPGAVPNLSPPSWMCNSVSMKAIPKPEDFDLHLPESGLIRAIGVRDGQILTDDLTVDAIDAQDCLERIAVIERHNSTGRLGLAFTKGFGLRGGAIASTVAHDAHNVMVVGGMDQASLGDMSVAVRRIDELRGGQVVVHGGEILAELPLEIGGLMSVRPAGQLASLMRSLDKAAFDLGVRLAAPFMQLSFLGLTVIPSLRVSDHGLIDVDLFRPADLLII